MKHVLGIGGVFVKAKDPEKLGAWYQEHLGIEMGEYGAIFRDGEASAGEPPRDTYAVWSFFESDTKYFAPSEKPFMVNFRVRDLDGLLTKLRGSGAQVDAKAEESEYGKFGWVMDPEGNRIELWEPPLAKA